MKVIMIGGRAFQQKELKEYSDFLIKLKESDTNSDPHQQLLIDDLQEKRNRTDFREKLLFILEIVSGFLKGWAIF